MRYRRKQVPRQVTLADGTPISYGKGKLCYETEEVELDVSGIKEISHYDIMACPAADMVIGADWLTNHNPDIDWLLKTVTKRAPATVVAGQRIKNKAVTEPTTGSVRQISTKDMDRTLRRQRSTGTAFEIRIHPKEQVNTLGTGTNDTASDDARSTKNGNERHVIAKDEEKSRNATMYNAESIPIEYIGFKDLFEDQKELETLPEHKPYDHRIELEDGADLKPEKLRPLTREQDLELQEHMNLNLRRGHWRKSKSKFASAILFVPKKTGKRMRLCIDYRRLNSITKKNRYPLPNIDDIMRTLQGAKWFTKFDIQEGFYNIRIAKGDEWKTAFRTPYGLFEYTVMPMGLTNAPATFQAVINAALHEFLGKFAVAYLDDVLVYSKGTLEEHIEDVKKVLTKLREYRLWVSRPKSEFHTTRTEYLGFIISRDHVEPDPKKIQSIADWKQPTTVKAVQSFLGLANFYRRFIKDYSRIAAPLSELTKLPKEDEKLTKYQRKVKRETRKIEWGPEQEKAFQTLKEAFLSATFLTTVDPEQPIKLETDASKFAEGAVLYTKKDNRWRVAAFHSRKFTDTERRYTTHDQELMAIVDALKVWRVYTSGTKYTVEVHSDHENLSRFMTTKELGYNYRQINWSQELANYDFKIIHKKGTDNAAADALSRRQEYEDDEDSIEVHEPMLKMNTDGSVTHNRDSRVAQLTSYLPHGGWEETLRKEYPQNRKEYCELGEQEQIAYHEAIRDHKTYVPTNRRQEVLLDLHRSPLYGHPGEDAMIAKVRNDFTMVSLRQEVKKVVQNCDECHRNKIKRHKPYGLLQPLGTPQRPWREVSMDFITKLPPSVEPGTNQVCTQILVIVDRFTKFVRFIPLHEELSSVELSYIIIRNLTADFGIPDKFISDRDKLFTAAFWKTLWAKLGVALNVSTAGHPQTDGQTERMNQVVEQYLRAFINEYQDNWAELLPLAQFAHNSTKSGTTKHSPFYANYGYEPKGYGSRKEPKNVSEAALDKAARIKEIHETIQGNLTQRAEVMRTQANKKRIEGPTFKEGDKVYLHRKNLRTKKPSKKFDEIRTGAFKIKRQTGPVNYELELPKKMRIHPNFHVSLLEPAPKDAPISEGIELDTEEFKVEEIQGLRRFGRQWKYLVKWDGYPIEENTWEPLKHLRKAGVKALVNAFHQRNPEQADPRRKEKDSQSHQEYLRPSRVAMMTTWTGQEWTEMMKNKPHPYHQGLQVFSQKHTQPKDEQGTNLTKRPRIAGPPARAAPSLQYQQVHEPQPLKNENPAICAADQYDPTLLERYEELHEPPPLPSEDEPAPDLVYPNPLELQLDHTCVHNEYTPNNDQLTNPRGRKNDEYDSSNTRSAWGNEHPEQQYDQRIDDDEKYSRPWACWQKGDAREPDLIDWMMGTPLYPTAKEAKVARQDKQAIGTIALKEGDNVTVGQDADRLIGRLLREVRRGGLGQRLAEE